MNAREQGFLLLTSQLGDPDRKPLSVAQLRTLAARVRAMAAPEDNSELTAGHLTALGYSGEMAKRILTLLSQQEELEYYLRKGRQAGCVPLTRVSADYPAAVRRRLGQDSPGCLWTKGDPSVLDMPRIALVGSRDLNEPNRRFAEDAGRQAALQGYALVSGNARGADKTAQEACLEAGGSVIAVVADRLESHRSKERVLYISEDDFDAAFSSLRALSRNRVIHCLADKTLVAQCTLRRGGTWDGTTRNLRFGWNDVFCFDDGSEAACQLEQLGATTVSVEKLGNIGVLQGKTIHFFDQ